MEYEVRITVTQQITVPVEADSMKQARAYAQVKWISGDFDNSATHSRLKRERVTYEPLYPDLSMAR